MTTRTHPHPANPSGTLIKYRIDIKQSGKWKPLRIRGAMAIFDNQWHANNAGLKINKFHQILTTNKCYTRDQSIMLKAIKPIKIEPLQSTKTK